MERKIELVRMRKLLLFLCLNVLTIAGFSQNLERYNWYFGNSSQAIRFNRTSTIPSIVNKAVPFGTGGSATASDPVNGNLLFYTDGSNVFDNRNLIMPNGGGLTANTSGNQTTLICPVPAQPGKYFIFTSNANFPAAGFMRVNVVNMNLFGNAVFPMPATGDIESKNVAVPGLVGLAEGMTIVPHTNGTDFWLITQTLNTSDYSSTLINAASYTGTFNTTTFNNIGLPTAAANLAYHAGKNKIAVSPQNDNTNAAILNVDPATGIITFDQFIFNSGMATTTNQSIYDIEWSPNGDFLYLSRHGEPGIPANLLQFDYLNPTTSLTTVLPGSIFRSYGVQMAPDSSLYHLYQAVAAGPFLLGRITRPDSVAAAVNYQSAVLSPASFNGRQFPVFAPRTRINLLVDFTFAGSCQNNNTVFFPDVIPGADSVQWNFGDGNGSNAWSPAHAFTTASTFNVSLTAFYQNQSQSTSKPVTIQPFDLQLQLVQDTTACHSEFPAPRGTSDPQAFSVKVTVTGGTATSYNWSNGDTGDTLTPDSAGYYYVVVSDGSGCSSYAGVNVKEYGLQDQRSNIWYFGNHAGIDFNEAPPEALSNSAMNAPEGCSIICDRNGKTIFYTDGSSVYDRTDTQIATLIGGDPLASQSTIIVPVPGDETLYYIFTNEAVNSGSGNMVRYSLFDLKQNGGLGAVTQSNLPLFARSTERITASGRWLIIHEFGNNTFRAYPITPDGIGNPTLTAIGTDHLATPVENSEGYMKLGPRDILAVTLSTPGTSNFVELFDLIDSSGVLTNFRRINLNEPTGQVYGVEFSPGGNKVFATVRGAATSHIFEYFIDSVRMPHFKQRITQPAELGAIQLAPDGQLYVAVNGTGNDFLGMITASDDTTAFSSFILNGFPLAASTNSRLGLPNFIQQVGNAFGGPSIDVAGVCLGSPTRFTGTPTDPIDHLFWSFGDGGTAIDSTQIDHTYATAQTYLVALRLTNRCFFNGVAELDTTLTRSVTIFPPPPPPTILGAVSLCNGPVTLDANTANLPEITSYLWSGGETTQTIQVTVQSIVSVEITDIHGCTSSGQSLIADVRPQLDLGPDEPLCQNLVVPVLNASNPGAMYAWTITPLSPPGAPTTATTRTVPVDTSVPGTFDYQVVITDPITTCTLTENKIITINPVPTFSIIGSPSVCLGSTGTLTVQSIVSSGPYTYLIDGPAPFTQTAVDQTAATIPVIGLAAGTYVVTITDQLSNCDQRDALGLSSSTFTATPAVLPPNCDPVIIEVDMVGAFVPNLTYQLTENSTGPIGGPVNVGVADPFTTIPVPGGTYTIEITDGGGCIFAINNFVVAPTAPVDVQFDNSGLCNTPPTILASSGTPGVTFDWSATPAPQYVGSPLGATLQVTGQGTFTYSVTATGGGGTCPNSTTNVVLLDNPAPDFTQSDPCQPTVQLTGSPNGPYIYQWYRNGSGSITDFGQFINANVDNDTYVVELRSTITGCTYLSGSKPVDITGIVDAGISADPACQDGQPVTLTASTVATGVTYAWSRNGTTIAGETGSTTSQTIEAVYKVDITKETCSASASLTLTRAPIPIGTLPNRLVICNDPENTDPATSQVDLDPGFFQAYDWFKNELNIAYTDRVLTADSEGTYRVVLTNAFNCEAPDEVIVLNDCQPKIDAPNAFRPSSSIDINKSFFAYTKFITEDFQIFIFNRWGELVFTSSERDFKWNGGMNNTLSQPLPGGSYSYVIKYTSSFHPERGVQERRGGVALLR